jgi:hypothetical protein
MFYATVTALEIGTASSGNRGHAGRKGERGGSAPKGGATLAAQAEGKPKPEVTPGLVEMHFKGKPIKGIDSPADEKEVAAALDRFNLDIETVRTFMTYPDPEAKLKEFRLEARGGAVTAEVRYAVPGTEEEVKINRLFFVEDGQAVCYNAAFEVPLAYQGKGVGSVVYANQLTMLKNAGFHKVVLYTTDVGTYAWAAKGFDYAEDVMGGRKVMLSNRTEDFRRTMASQYGLTAADFSGGEWPAPKSARDFSQLTIPTPKRLRNTPSFMQEAADVRALSSDESTLRIGKLYFMKHHYSWKGELVLNKKRTSQ